ncbi:chitinase C-terminal domain-containing protein [Aliikangiella sp. G2MR2-5]|uniref:chitinase C-terminal domain-containing protein n=1 Tax=Aliikangiella sp. G2MR2-5 TaxID=2788943 RepID=UPI001AEDCA07|nr:glycosyl hydrolase family 18 protein [Aliikangiella sp. G2MR2-5]
MKQKSKLARNFIWSILASSLLMNSPFASAAPGTPNIAWMPTTYDAPAEYTIHWDMWWGNNGNVWYLLENGNVIHSASLTPNGQNQQSAELKIKQSSGGQYTYQVKLCDDRVSPESCTQSASKTITVNGGVVNQPPIVNAGPDRSIEIGKSASLSGNYSDDGISTPVTSNWTQVTGPGITTFANASSANTSATFSTTGSYTLRLSVDDNEFTVSDEMVVNVTEPQVNQPPVANAGNDFSAVTNQSTQLNGRFSDDGKSSPLTELWKKVSGPGNVTFADVNKGNSSAIFSAKGIYVLSYMVDDSEFTSIDEVTVTVSDDPVSQTDCRPDGLYTTPSVKSPYCTRYDSEGREKMGGKTRRVIGYFTSWRTGNNGPAYLAHQIPWEHLTHINYAFAHVDANNKVSVGANTANNPATGMEWPDVIGAEMDPSYTYKGHFNLLNKFKKQYPHVKTMISVGGWAETGGFFDANGNRVASGGFYSMTTNADGSINHTGINTFANSAVDFIRTYGFDGVDIDYEYATSMKDAGNPDDFAISNGLRGGLNASYVELMKVLRQKLDAAGAQDGIHYLLTVAAPSSGYLLRGMEVYESAKYLDYINIMSYDLHGAWNQFVGPNAALFDNGEDAELLAWNAYGGAYENIGYLNTDWAYHYFRGSVPAGRINIGVPYYTRGWQGVQGGTNGLWGSASLPDQSQCPPGTGTGETNNCGYGAIGIDNLWHDKNSLGEEMGAGSNPMWHAKNLETGILGSYVESYGLDPVNNPAHQLQGNYQRFYNSTMVTPWLWNAEKKVFLSTEDLESINHKADYVVDKGIGGIMFWELAGDFQFNTAKGEYEMGSSMTEAIANKFASATPYGNKRAEITLPTSQIDVQVSVRGFALGDSNYPITPEVVIKNNTGVTLPGGTEFYFDYSTSAPGSMNDQSGAGLSVINDGSNAAGNNIGGLENNFHRVKFALPGYMTLANGGEWAIKVRYYLPVSMLSNWTVKINGKEFAIKQEHPELPKGELDSGGGNPGGDTCESMNIDPTQYNEYPNWTRTDWAGNPNHAETGDRMRYQSTLYQAKYWTSAIPGSGDSWTLLCSY